MLPSLAVVAACATTGAIQPVGAPVENAPEVFADLAESTVPSGPQQVSFGWTLDEAGSRVYGRGVVRHHAPERLRLDLFGPRNESYLSAAMVGEEVRLPPGAAPGAAIPSPALLWAGLGVVRPPPGATLMDASANDEGVTVVRFRAPNGETYQYRLLTAGARPRLDRVERAGSRGVIETVRLEWGAADSLSRARYRDWSAFRDLTLELETIRDVETFPDAVWTP